MFTGKSTGSGYNEVSDQPVARGVGRNGSAGRDIELAQNDLDVAGDGAPSDPERLGNLLIGETFDEQAHDLEFTGGEGAA